MRKIIGYKLAIAVTGEEKSLGDQVMEIVAEDPRWELAGGPSFLADPEPGGEISSMQALVMYEGSDEVTISGDGKLYSVDLDFLSSKTETGGL